MKERVYTALYPFGGIGGGAIGGKAARARLFGVEGSFRVIGGIDVNADACNNFEHLAGAPSLCADVATLSAYELRRLCPDSPDFVFLSPPCKGASGLLSAEKAATEKYQAMNRLALDLQSFLEYIPLEQFVLAGASHSQWREHIGNAVPPAASERIHERALYTLLAADLGGFVLDGDLAVWV